MNREVLVKNVRQRLGVSWSTAESSRCPAREFRKSLKFPRQGKDFHRTGGSRVQVNLFCSSSSSSSSSSLPHRTTPRIRCTIKSWRTLKDTLSAEAFPSNLTKVQIYSKCKPGPERSGPQTGPRVIFQQDNDPEHKTTRDGLRDKSRFFKQHVSVTFLPPPPPPPPPVRNAAGQLSEQAWPVTSPKRPNLKPGTQSPGEDARGHTNGHRAGTDSRRNNAEGIRAGLSAAASIFPRLHLQLSGPEKRGRSLSAVRHGGEVVSSPTGAAPICSRFHKLCFTPQGSPAFTINKKLDFKHIPFRSPGFAHIEKNSSGRRRKLKVTLFNSPLNPKTTTTTPPPPTRPPSPTGPPSREIPEHRE
ncbi:unnamed protein product [Pleuronectes platessa]|uniref:Uncharacterized protein n=1 Tax=Pleuronectes platessa TaxID=8262 RepID=A0A9N7YP01_PLEPL|nr:unnamed protein product [Pleuronectes platessa]